VKTSLLMAAGAAIDLMAAGLLWVVGFRMLAVFMFVVAAAIGAYAFVQWRRGM
jgi:hypothetical protein